MDVYINLTDQGLDKLDRIEGRVDGWMNKYACNLH